MRLILVRHGETNENVNGISQGHLNSKLNEKGIKQAKAVAERLKNEKIDFVYSSDLDRAVTTCGEIMKFHPKVNVVQTRILREQCKGVYEGKCHTIRDDFLKKQKIKYFEFKPEGGESIIDLWEKVIPFFDVLREKHRDKSVLVVSHGGPLACILSFLHNDTASNFWKYHMNNTGLSFIEIDGSKCKFYKLNCEEHL